MPYPVLHFQHRVFRSLICSSFFFFLFFFPCQILLYSNIYLLENGILEKRFMKTENRKILVFRMHSFGKLSIFSFRLRNDRIHRTQFYLFRLNQKSSQMDTIPLTLSKLYSIHLAIRGRMNDILFCSFRKRYWSQKSKNTVYYYTGTDTRELIRS